jgi:hypothetical protein
MGACAAGYLRALAPQGRAWIGDKWSYTPTFCGRYGWHAVLGTFVLWANDIEVRAWRGHRFCEESVVGCRFSRFPFITVSIWFCVWNIERNDRWLQRFLQQTISVGILRSRRRGFYEHWSHLGGRILIKESRSYLEEEGGVWKNIHEDGSCWLSHAIYIFRTKHMGMYAKKYVPASRWGG